MLIKYPCPENNISCHPIQLLLTRGKWKIELWGAGTTNGGGYTSGELSLMKAMTLFVFLGGQEMPIGTKSGYGGYNGGGNCTTFGKTNSFYRQSGGSGATDIRTIENDISSRIMVAGGSGGGSCDDIHKIPGGYGGGLIGGNGTHNPIYPSTGYGKGGTQDEGGKGYKPGSLFEGAPTAPASSSDCVGAGGGGYYGGGSGYDKDVSASGGGGSSYISGYKDCIKHASNIVFRKAVMIPGNESMPQPNGNAKSGYIGQGVARITFLSFFNTCKLKNRSILCVFTYILIINS